MGYIAALLVFSIVNFIISMLIAPPEKKSGKVWFTRYTMLSFRLVVLSMVIYFILDNSGWK